MGVMVSDAKDLREIRRGQTQRGLQMQVGSVKIGDLKKN